MPHLHRRLQQLERNATVRSNRARGAGQGRRRGRGFGRGVAAFRRHHRRARRSPLVEASSTPFQFGFRYTHFWYTMQPRPPFRMLSTSEEFCIASAQDSSDCESVQFVSGIVLDAGRARGEERVLMSMGINDCEAKLAHMPLADVWSMLRPLEGEDAACV